MSDDHHTADAMIRAIQAALPGAEVEVEPAGGRHFRVAVASASFAGQRTLARHRAVLGALAPLMAGDDAPVHAIDELVTRDPAE